MPAITLRTSKPLLSGSIAGIGGNFYQRTPNSHQMLAGCFGGGAGGYLAGTLPPNFHLSKFSMTNSCSKLPISGGDDSCDESLSEHRSNVIRMKSFGSTISIPRCRQQQQQQQQHAFVGGPCLGHSSKMSSSQHHLPRMADYGGADPCSETVTITTKVS